MIDRDAHSQMKVLVLHSLPPVDPGLGRHVFEFDMSAGAEGIREVLPDAELAGVRGDVREVLSVLESHPADVVFNLCEAPLGRPDREAHAAALLEWLGVRYTGARSEALALCRRKDRVAAVLATAGVPVPQRDRFPCIVKSAEEHGSVGLDHTSICEDAKAVARATAQWQGSVIVQEFLPGREFAVALWGAATPDHYSIGETRFQGGLRLNTYAAKWDIDSADFANSPIFYDRELEPELRDAVIASARGAWQAVGARGYLRVDVRLDNAATPRVIDVNANPELSPGVGMHRAVTEAGWTWERFVRQLIDWAA
jgi:D-alanine-D-alanine ligase